MKGHFTFTCECTLERNGVEVAMKNSKAKQKTIKLGPFTDTSQPDQEPIYYVSIFIGNSDEVLYRTRVESITKIQNRFMSEGKMTLEIAEEVNPLSHKVHIASDHNLKEYIKPQKFLLIMIKNAQPDVLKSFCNELADKKKKKTESAPPSEKKPMTPIPSQTGRLSAQKVSEKDEKIKASTPLINRSENNLYKVNRPIAPQVQSQEKLKRNFDSLKKSSSKEFEQVSKRFKWTIQNPFETLPELVIFKIMKYLPSKEMNELKLLNKYFSKIIDNGRSIVDFRKKGDVPPGIITRLLANCKNLEKVYLGPSKYLKPKQFVDDIKIESKKLHFIDFSNYSTLDDKIVKQFYYNNKTLETIKMGYYSSITDSVIEMLPSLLSDVKGLYIKSSSKTHDNKRDKLTDTTLANFIKKYQALQHFSIYIVGSVFLYKAFEEPILNLRTFKIDIITLSQKSDILMLENLSKLENLEYLKIGRVIVNRLDVELFPSDCDMFKEIFSKVNKLKTAKFGQIANNYVMLHLSRNCENLERLVVGSDFVDDEGMSHILKNAAILRILDFNKCQSVNGHCLEDILSYKLEKLIVNFDEYKMKCSRNILAQKMLLNCAIENKLKKK